jgi:cyclopropane fatty-acyl-phospholipid synthase-like methyltransferase
VSSGSTSFPGFALAAGYDGDWLRSLDMGPNPLLQAEAMLPDLNLRPGQRILDLGCGRGASSVFFARECGVEVVAFDLWIEEATVTATIDAFGLRHRIRAVRGDARDLPFGENEFDALVSIDAFEYFGTDVRFLPTALRVLKPGGRIAISTPGLVVDPYLADPPSAVTDLVGWEAAAWHAPAWWQRHWELTGMVERVYARMQPHGHQHWLTWSRELGDRGDATTRMLEAVPAAELGIVLVSAVRL